jgi:hypothetical protein
MIHTMSGNGKKRVIVDPAVQDAEDAFQRMMTWFKGMTREERSAVRDRSRPS